MRQRPRAGHTHGKSYRDVVNGSYGRFPHPPDQVARPRTEQDIVDLLDWCAAAGVTAVPYGGGSSVTGGVSCAVDDATAVVSIDLTALDRVLEIEPISRSARIQGGALGPVLEDQLRPHGYTLRHYPQSFEFSTLGGWLATRSGGHYATVYTHIEDLLESLRIVTPTGVSQSLNPCSDIYTAAIDPVIVSNDISNIHPNSELKFLILNKSVILFLEFLLDVHSTLTAARCIKGYLSELNDSYPNLSQLGKRITVLKGKFNNIRTFESRCREAPLESECGTFYCCLFYRCWPFR